MERQEQKIVLAYWDSDSEPNILCLYNFTNNQYQKLDMNDKRKKWSKPASHYFDSLQELENRACAEILDVWEE